MRWMAHAALIVLLGCAHAGRTELESANDAFAREVRWTDLAGLAQQIAPERQAEFARLIGPNEDTLKVDDYEVQDVQVSGDKAIVRSRISWFRQPSITNKTE